MVTKSVRVDLSPYSTYSTSSTRHSYYFRNATGCIDLLRSMEGVVLDVVKAITSLISDTERMMTFAALLDDRKRLIKPYSKDNYDLSLKRYSFLQNLRISRPLHFWFRNIWNIG